MACKQLLVLLICMLCLATVFAAVDGSRKSKKPPRVEKSDLEDENYDLMAEDDEDDDDDEPSNEDFKFDDRESGASDASEFHRLSWITVDLCKDVQCKPRQHCVMKSKEVATCVPSPRKKKLQPPVSGQVRSGADKANKRRPKPSGHIDATIIDKRVEGCRQCPVTKPDFVCGTDNSTYSSLCRLTFHNCIHQTRVRTACFGFCPCKAKKSAREQSKSDDRSRQRWDKFYAKAKNDKAWKRRSEERWTNEIDGKPPQNKPKSIYPHPVDMAAAARSGHGKHRQEKVVTCSKEELKVMGNRLLDWFSVVLADQKRRKKVSSFKKTTFSTIPACTPEVTWMFHHLDTDNDKRLSLKELFDLEHDEKEKCLKPYLDTCDTDRDTFLNPFEWCTCFTTKTQSCTSAAKVAKNGLVGAYVPQCDKRGFYTPVQCHGGSGICWCVDKNGIEFVNTRRRGKPDCDELLNKARQRNENQDEDEDDDDDDDEATDGDDDVEGSGSA